VLADVQIRKAKAADKPYKLADGGDRTSTSRAGRKLWRLSYKFERTEKLLSIGPYPSSGSQNSEKLPPTRSVCSGWVRTLPSRSSLD